MTAKNLISDAVPPLKTSDTGNKAIAWLNEFHVNHLPIVNNKEFLGLISEEDILDLSNPDAAIGDHKLALLRPTVNEDQHIFDVMKVAAELKLTLIPVIDSNNQYLGVITLADLLGHFTSMSSFLEPGGILMLLVNANDYSLSEIAQIVESNDAQILSLYISTHQDSTKMEVTLKINRLDLKHIVATFERYEYQVTAAYQESDHTDYLKGL
jgi:CBS domain-containing protein